MNPDQNQYSIDYLNQISTQPKKSGMNDRFFLFIVGGGLLFAIIVGLILLTSSSNGPTQKMETLAAQLQTLQTISSQANANIQDDSLSATNSTLTLLLTNINLNIAAPLKTNGVDVTKIDKAISNAENGAALTQTLENAKLNAVYDRTYAREMSYQLATVIALMKEIYNDTHSTSLKTFLNTTYLNLQPIQTQFANFTDPTSGS